MTELAKQIKDKLNISTVNMDELNRVLKDRLDFGFDSIYFRYAEVVDELSWMKLKEERSTGNMNFDRKTWANNKKMHFYDCLEQLLHAHEGDNNDINK